MYTNLHTLPPGQAMFTLYVGQPDKPDQDEYDQAAPVRTTGSAHQASVVILEAKDNLVELYGDEVEVRVVINQSTGQIEFASGWRGFRPIPVVPGPRLTEAYNPDLYDGRQTIGYDVIIDLCQDEQDGKGGADYLDWLLDNEQEG